MIKMLTAYTEEADDKEAALEEILEMLDLDHNALSDSVGLMSFYPDFIETGVAAYIAKNLPFDVIGKTSIGSSVPEERGTMILSISVITSDELHFEGVATGNLTEDMDQEVSAAFRDAVDVSVETPSFIISFMPMIQTMGGELILNALREASGDVAPIFGGIACDQTDDFSKCFTLLNGEVYSSGAVMAVFFGNIEPSFFVVSISEDRLQRQRAVITESNGTLLRSVNDMPVDEYLTSLGLGSYENGAYTMSAVPFVVDYEDGTPPVARAIYGVMENGEAICGGTMPINSTLAVGALDKDDVLKTSEQKVREILSSGKTNGILMFPCVSRFMVMGAHMMEEMNMVQRVLSNDVPYFLSYVGGELCPVYDKSRSLSNRFHNFSFIACAF